MTRQQHQQEKPRRIRFHSLDSILQDAERIARADHVKQLGNWSPGQAFEHLAKSFCSSIRESKAKLPIWNRTIALIVKPLLLRFGLPAGIQIESVSEAAAREFLPGDQVPVVEGLRKLRNAINAISAQHMSARHNLFGRMSRVDWLRMHCRHAELHLRLLIPLDSLQHGDLMITKTGNCSGPVGSPCLGNSKPI